MREENIFVINFFVIKYFRYELIFHVKTANLLNEVTQLFPSNPTLKIENLLSPPFSKFGRRPDGPRRKRVGGGHDDVATLV